MLKHAFVLACLCSFTSGCSVIVANSLDDKDGGADGGRIDASANDLGMDMFADPDAGEDAGEPVDFGTDATYASCEGASDGTACGPMGSADYICVGGTCNLTTCGDGYIDSEAGEECEDGNPTAFDGCEPSTCKYTCRTNDQCDDGEPCTGAETCNSTLHRCQGAATLPPEDSTCSTEAVPTGICRGGTCVLAGCGDGEVTSAFGEECDDRNTTPGDGCENNCQYSCESDTDCDDGDVCTGVESCDISQHKCVAGASLTCDDSKACTVDSCDPESGCLNVLMDGDGDGVSPTPCMTGYATDCNDADSSTYPGAPQMCGTTDHNCDMMPDMSGTVTCFPDNDNDGYPLSSMPMTGCSCPDNYIPARPDGAIDCLDNVGGAYPMAPDYHTDYASCSMYLFTGSGFVCSDKNFDWNCNGTEELQYTYNSTGCFAFNGLCLGSGWTGTTDPACGVEAQYRTCRFLLVIGGGTGSCSGTLSDVRQGCR